MFEPGTSHMMMRCKLTQQACFFSQFGGLLPFSSWRSGEDPENFPQLDELLSNQLMQCMTKKRLNLNLFLQCFTSNPGEFVIFDENQAFPEYIAP